MNKNHGQTLIEALVALTTIMLTLAAISIAITTSLSNSNFSSNQTRASKSAQEGMEYIRYLKNTDPFTFQTRTGIYCHNSDNTMEAGTCQNVNIDGIFIREVEFVHLSPECSGGTKVTSKVFWSSPKCADEDNRYCHNSELISCFALEEISNEL